MAHSRWEEARAQKEEYERLSHATELVAHAAADLQRAAAAVGDHILALALREGVDPIQVLQAQVVSAAEKARARGQRAAREAQQAHFQQQVDAASGLDPFVQPPNPDE